MEERVLGKDSLSWGYVWLGSFTLGLDLDRVRLVYGKQWLNLGTRKSLV